MKKVYDITPIIDEIQGFAGVFYPEKDANGKFVLDQDSLKDKLLESKWDLIKSCQLIDHEPLPRPANI